MKKLFIYMTMFLAAALFTVSCSNDDDDRSPEEIADLLTAGDWQGFHRDYLKDGGSWVIQNSQFIVIRFVRPGNRATNGTGTQLAFKSATLNEFEESSDFVWSIDGDVINISYTAGWDAVHANRKSDIQLDANKFSGNWFPGNTDHRYEFDYDRKSFADWGKYGK